jgi:hypothetical protein
MKATGQSKKSVKSSTNNFLANSIDGEKCDTRLSPLVFQSNLSGSPASGDEFAKELV